MIKIKNLTKKYGKNEILSHANFTFPDSGLVCLLGASGCGKSTLLNLLAGFDTDYSGEIVVGGTSISKMNAEALCAYRRDNIGFIFQNYNLLAGYTVVENILLACELQAGSDERNKEKVKVILKRLNMLDKENEKVENLSGGQKQRVAIARALINQPSIILADEPTGALDRKNSTEIMELLKEISTDCLVLVITHDQKICAFAEKTISIKEGKIIGAWAGSQVSNGVGLKEKETVKGSAFARGMKNFKVHLTRYMAVSLAISIGVLAFVLSLSSGNSMENSISDFKEKNTAFNNGYIQVEQEEKSIFSLLQSDQRTQTVYYQYIIKNVTLQMGEQSHTLAEKYPMPKATQSMSYGVMPKMGKQQIALNPSLAKKFSHDISKLVGKEITLKQGAKEYKVTISGIFNADYDDFYISSDLEQAFYNATNDKKIYAISYDVKNFEDIVAVTQMLTDKEIQTKTAVMEVEALQNTFENLSRLFLLVSILILGIGLFISIILLVKLQNSRYREIGLLSALGFRKSTIRAMIINENILLSVMAAVFNAVLIGCAFLVSTVFNLGIIITAPQILLSVLGTGLVIVLIGMLASHKLIHTEPAVALRK